MKPLKTLLTFLLFPLVALRAAEPSKSINPNTWIKAETDHPDAIYKCGEKAVFRVSVADKAPNAPSEINWTLTLDGAKVLGQGTLTLKPELRNRTLGKAQVAKTSGTSNGDSPNFGEVGISHANIRSSR